MRSLPSDPRRLEELSWPPERLAEAIEALGKLSGYALRSVEVRELPHPPVHGAPAEGAGASGASIGRGPQPWSLAPWEQWLDAVSARLGLEAVAVDAPYGEAGRLISSSAPAILGFEGDSGPRFLALVASGPFATRRRGLGVLSPDRRLEPVAPGDLRSALCRETEGSVSPEVERLLEAARIDGRRRTQARAALLGELLRERRVGGVWLLRACGAAPARVQAREARLLGPLVGLLAGHTLYFALWLLSWWFLGRGALEGRLDRGWLVAWTLVLLTLVPFRILSVRAGGLLSVRAGAYLKRRLLLGALRLDPDDVRHLGAGGLLGRVLESDAVERLAITGGFLGLTAALELAMAACVLAFGVGGWLHLSLLVAWTAVGAGLAFRYLRRRGRWAEARMDLTCDLVESMVGHRTRLVQEAQEGRGEREVRALDAYHGLSSALDRSATLLRALLPRGWLVLGVLGVAPAFVWAEPQAGPLAVAVGGVLLALHAFRDLGEGLERILGAAVSWKRVRPFWEAASRPEETGLPQVAATPAPREGGPLDGRERGPLLDVHSLTFRYRGRSRAVLRDLNLRMEREDRVLLEGVSGGGKSTLAALLAGSRTPEAGLLLLDGLDRRTLGDSPWRRRVVFVPQFQDNHVLMGPLAFNLLMGRGWPPTVRDLEEAEEVCRAVGLGPLLERMPARLQQPVGETGWQLSHGERGRLYMARAILGGADLIILDESFAALDPETLRRAMTSVLEGPPALMVIAHP